MVRWVPQVVGVGVIAGLLVIQPIRVVQIEDRTTTQAVPNTRAADPLTQGVAEAAPAEAESAVSAVFNPQQRPYTADSIWNTPIPADAVIDTLSDAFIATIQATVTGGQFSAQAERFTFTVYYADATTPRHDVPCVMYSCTEVLDHETRHPRILQNVPIPDDARPSPGDDLMIVIDTQSGEEFGLYHPRRTADGWEVDNAYRYSFYYDGVPADMGARAAGLPYLAGLIRLEEIRRGVIDHALAFGYPHVNNAKCVYPSSKLDDGTTAVGIPLGARLQLNPTLTDEDFDAMGLTESGKVIARAMQRYGMILVDYAGAPKIYIEDITTNQQINLHWEQEDLGLGHWALRDLPYDEFRVLALPDAYHDPLLEAMFHGDCYAYP